MLKAGSCIYFFVFLLSLECFFRSKRGEKDGGEGETDTSVVR